MKLVSTDMSASVVGEPPEALSEWSPLLDGAWMRALPSNAELLVHNDGAMFSVTLHHNKIDIWKGVYPTVTGAKLAGTAAAKRLLRTADAPAAAAEEPGTASIAILSEARQRDGSIWKPTGLKTVVERNGIVAYCAINFLDDGFEGVTRLGDYVSRQHFSDEWTAKRSTLQWVSLLLERHA
ncbi:hypothetical protein [Tianweitania sediminis]|uniref:Uncharacterized protein n=1 Tax=Tianweitania sediminis TaxID=1502156 RepID=A0A8J7UL79_9HYPH|nr:hypothetical protein [Tianweitania sediminis]MBP0439117.1 hypothetical protein [Tianweitania sediminis]